MFVNLRTKFGAAVTNPGKGVESTPGYQVESATKAGIPERELKVMFSTASLIISFTESRKGS